LAGVGEVGDDGSNSAGAGGSAGVDHDEHLHETIIDIAGGGRLEDEDYGKGSAAGSKMSRSRVGGAREDSPQVHPTSKAINIPSSSRTDSPMVMEVSWFE
jgi:hypothetical protein